LGTVYQDLRVLEATWRLMDSNPAIDSDPATDSDSAADERVIWTIPDDNRDLVERGTNPHVLHRIMEEKRGEDATAWGKHGDFLFGKNSAERLSAKSVCLPYDKPFMDVDFPDDDLNPAKTRLGLDDVTAELPEPVPSPFHPDGPSVVRRLSIPQYWLRDREDDGPLPDTLDVEVDTSGLSSRGEILLTVAGRRFRYSRTGLSIVT